MDTMVPVAATLKVSEIFLSIQGESLRAGFPCTIVRLGGCNLRCSWCDTEYAWDEGEDMSLSTVLARVGGLGCRRVEVTGGEPLIQPSTCELLRRLCDGGYEVLLETNGSVDISGVDARVIKVIDVKCPSSGEADTTRWENLDNLIRGDEIKFVIADRKDYEYALSAVQARDLPRRAMVSFSPVTGRLASDELAAWILADRIDVRLNLQLHKIIWPEKVRGV